MKTIYNTIYASAAALLFVGLSILSSCTKADEPKGNIPSDGVMRFEASSQGPLTRAGYDSENISGITLLNFWAATQGEAAGSSFIYDSYILHYVDSEWKTASAYDLRPGYGFTECTLLWKDSQTPVDITASNFGGAESGAALSSYTLVKVISTQCFEYDVKYSDLLFFKGTVNPTLASDAISEGVVTEYALADGKIRLPMQHICSKLVVTVTLGTDFSAEGGIGRSETNPFEQSTIVKGTHRYDHFDMNTGTFLGDFKDYHGNISSTANIYMYPTSYTPATSTTTFATATFEAILIPQTVAAGSLEITFKLGDKNYKWSSASDITFVSKERYSLDINVGGETVPLKYLLH